MGLAPWCDGTQEEADGEAWLGIEILVLLEALGDQHGMHEDDE